MTGELTNYVEYPAAKSPLPFTYHYPSTIDRLDFYEIAPKSRIDESLFDDQMKLESIKETIGRRVSEYDDDSKREWFKNWFLPVLDVASIRIISWEEILDVIGSAIASDAEESGTFYKKRLSFSELIRKGF